MKAPAQPAEDESLPGAMRLDKWLWAARFYKTRALAAEALDKGQVLVNDSMAKRSRQVHVGDRLNIRLVGGGPPVELRIEELLAQRGPAERARRLYVESETSVQARIAWAQARRDAPNPGQDSRDGRPTKRDRRERVAWERWSVSLDDRDRR